MTDKQEVTPEELAKKIAAARHIVVLSGAGMSTAAGVPDFRGPEGLYVTRRYDPEKVFEISYFSRDPAPFFQFSRDFLSVLATIEPTFTHYFLARLEERNIRPAIVTQNIDGLHQKAGSSHVLPMHGDYQTGHCRRCGYAVRGSELADMILSQDLPSCPQCGGVIKPDVVFFGESVKYLEDADRLTRESDLMLVLGSSLQVYPAAMLPLVAGGEVAVVNKGRTDLSRAANVRQVDADLDTYFREVERCL